MAKLRPFLYVAVLLGLGLGFSPRAYAHHGYAAYDLTKTITVSGSVTEMMMANPHSSLAFDVKDDKGNSDHWAVEFGTLRGLVAEGWTKDTLKPGDQITSLCTLRKTALTSVFSLERSPSLTGGR